MALEKTGILLVNLGTPASPNTADVRRYLDEFLMDPFVIDIPAPLRWFLVKVIILNTRPAKSAHAYQKIWTTEGSPLMVYSQGLFKKVQKLLPNYSVKLAMRYAEPSLESQIRAFEKEGIKKVKVLALYPQWAFASSDSIVGKLKEIKTSLTLEILGAFYNDPEMIQVFAENTQKTAEGLENPFYLFSYHGVPERQLLKNEATQNHCTVTDKNCSKQKREEFENELTYQVPECCLKAADKPAMNFCYRAQCYATTNAIVKKLQIAPENFTLSFQSRLGRTPWIAPYTDFVIPGLAKKGIKNLVVLCPSFVADCLETLEEIQIRAREDFIAAGGSDLRLVPSLNQDSAWAQAVKEIVLTSPTILTI